MGKNIVLCFDGTGNEYGGENTNVVKLFEALEYDAEKQITFYDPGVGTFSMREFYTKAAKTLSMAMGLAFGRGLTRNVLESYRFLMANYEEGDQIYVFGFSRGSYTARVLAGLIHSVGLLYPEKTNLCDYAMRVYKYEKFGSIPIGFKKTFSRECPIRFLGLWDTVSSVGWVWDPDTFPFTCNNPSVAMVRHAVSLDERRAFFRQNLWDDQRSETDLKQVWFAGVHSDVGGGYPYPECGLSKIALEWMMVEARDNGIIFDDIKAHSIIDTPVGPDAVADQHASLKGWWWPLELWPKLVRYKVGEEWKKRLHCNLGRYRIIPDDAVLHQSVIDRIKDKKPKYYPHRMTKALDKYGVEGWKSY